MTAEEIRADEDINLLDYWRVLVKRRRLFFLIVGTAIIASVAVSLLLPKIYAATASLLPPQESASGAGLITSQLPSGLGGLAGGVLGGKSPTDLWMGILKSRTVFDEVVAEFELKTRYRAKNDTEARERLRDAVKIKKSKEDILSITVENRDPALAAEMANAFVEKLDRINQSILTTSGGRMRAFIEKRLKEAKVALTNSEDAVKAFQEENGAVKLDVQSKAIIEAIGTVKGELMAKEVALKTLLSYATPQNPDVKILKTEVKELSAALSRLEKGREGVTSKGIFIPTDRLPNLGLQYARLLRDAKIHETLYGLLTEQFEMARIQEAKDSSTVQVLDIATVPEKKVKPKRALIVILSTFTAGFFAVFLIFFLEYIEAAKARSLTTE
ncbi:MAG: GumC family protein [Nitrospiria bacterium]